MRLEQFLPPNSGQRRETPDFPLHTNRALTRRQNRDRATIKFPFCCAAQTCMGRFLQTPTANKWSSGSKATFAKFQSNGERASYNVGIGMAIV